MSSTWLFVDTCFHSPLVNAYNFYELQLLYSLFNNWSITLNFSSSGGCVVVSHCGLRCISMKCDYIEHFFMCLLPILYLFQSVQDFCPFFELGYLSFIIVIKIPHAPSVLILYHICFVNIFSQFVACLFINGVFWWACF